MPHDETISRTPRSLLLLAWLVVLIPSAWGVSQTVVKSLDLFKAAPPATTAPAR